MKLIQPRFRFHAFRKTESSQLPKTDCHHSLRKDILLSSPGCVSPICISVAWDWQFLGSTEQGIDKYSQLVFNIGLENQQKKVPSLAIHVTCLLRLADNLSNLDRANLTNDNITIILGILPTIEKILHFHKRIFEKAGQSEEVEIIQNCSYSVDGEPNCSICHYELPNHYMVLSERNKFRFCLQCYDSLEYRKNKKVKSHLNNKKDRTLKLCYSYMPLEREESVYNTLKELVSK